MADLSVLLAVLEHDPDDAQALAALEGAARSTPPELRGTDSGLLAHERCG
jgi:hypothetical protein